METSKPALTEEDVEEYLLQNEKFLENYLRKHGSSHRFSLTGTNELKKNLKFNERGNSLANNMFKDYVDGLSRHKKRSYFERQKLLAMSESEMFMELIRDIASELDVNVLCHKILRNVSVLTGSDRGSLFLVRGSNASRYLVSKLFDVTESSTIEDSLHTEQTEIRVPFGKGIAGTVALTKETINIKEAYQDPRFNKEIDKKTGYQTQSILCMPILNYEGEVIGVAQIINKVTGTHYFEEQDIEVFRKYLMFCGIGITNAQLFEMSVLECKRNKLLLSLAHGVFEEQQSLEKLVQKIMVDAQDLLQCDKCTIYLIDNTLDAKERNENIAIVEETRHKSMQDIVFSKAFDLYAKYSNNIHVQSAQQLTSKNAQIAQYVVYHNDHLSIPDLEVDGRFGKGPFTEEDGFTTKSILCMPVYNGHRKITAVAMFINKVNDRPFNENDASIIEAFSIFTGLGIHNCQMYEDACKLMAKQKVAIEVLSFHATAGLEETEKLVNTPIKSAEELKLYSFDFNDLVISEDETLQSVISMFKESGLIQKFKIPMDVMCRWTCSVKKNYRPVTYHNWRHGFSVTQTMFTILFTGQLVSLFSDLEIFSMLVACLCHDLDHRGRNNAFQVKILSPLATLYSTSVMERHHFDHCILILNSKGNNIFQSLNPDDYRTVIKMLEYCILSTDLSIYYSKKDDFRKLIEAGHTEFKNEAEKDLLKAMMMTASDVAAITKPWEIQQEVAQLVASEFFEQGDIEKTQFGETPIAMDRDKKDELPKMQVGFIDTVCMPVYKMLLLVSPNLEPLHMGLMENRRQWQYLDDLHKAGKTEEVHRELKNRHFSIYSTTSDKPINHVSVEPQSAVNPGECPTEMVKDKHWKCCHPCKKHQSDSQEGDTQICSLV